MKVVLPDRSELELADGATGLDAARAIGPKLAEQAVLVRANGTTRDLRLPLADGDEIQILTTRDTQDPTRSTCCATRPPTCSPRRCAACIRGKGRDRPAIENGFYYDFEFPEPITEADLGAIEDEVRREIAEGRTWRREVVGRSEARERFRTADEPYKVELVDTAEGDISLYTQGDFNDLCRGPHLQDAAPIKAFKLTGLAGAYWRGDEKRTQLTRIYGTAFYSQADLDAYLERLELARRGITGGSAASSTCSISTSSRRDRRSGTRRAWRSSTPSRSSGAARTPGEATRRFAHRSSTTRRSGSRRATGRSSREHVPDPGRRRAGLRRQADELPGGTCCCTDRSCGATGTCRCGTPRPPRCTATSSSARSTVSPASATSPRTTRTSSARGSRSTTSSTGRSSTSATCTASSASSRAELSTRPENKLGSDEEWDFTEGKLVEALARHDVEYFVGEGEGSFYGPKIDLHVSDSLGRSWQLGRSSSTRRCPLGSGSPTSARTTRASGLCRPPRALRLDGALHRDPDRHYGGAFPFWLAPVQLRVIPVGEGHRDAAHSLRDRIGAAGYRVEVDERDDTVGKRIRDAEIARDPVRDRLRRPRVRRLTRGARARRRPVDSLARGAARGVSGADCYDLTLPSRSGPAPHLRARARGGSTESQDDEERGRCVQRLSCFV